MRHRDRIESAYEQIRPRSGLTLARILSTGLLLAALLSQSAVSHAASGVVTCSTSIKNCGCSITSSGLYAVLNDISISSVGDCIAINAKNVVLYLNGFTLTGPNNATSTGAAVHVKGGDEVLIEGAGATLTGFNYGIWNAASNVVAKNFTAQNNLKAGIYFYKAKNSVALNFTATDNGGYGVWLSASDLSQIAYSTINDNTLDGVLVGCKTSSTNAALCSSTGGPSNQDSVFNNVVQNNGASGITVQFNANQAQVGENTATGNQKDDFIDTHTTGCGSDIWFANLVNGGVANKSCITNGD